MTLTATLYYIPLKEKMPYTTVNYGMEENVFKIKIHKYLSLNNRYFFFSMNCVSDWSEYRTNTGGINSNPIAHPPCVRDGSGKPAPR